MPSGWIRHARFQEFLSTTREHNRLLTSKLLLAMKAALVKRAPGLNVAACVEALLVVSRRRHELFVNAYQALAKFAEETKGSVSPSEVDTALECIQTPDFIVRLLAKKLPSAMRGSSALSVAWGPQTRTAEVWLVLAISEDYFRSDARRLGYVWDNLDDRSRARRDLETAGFVSVGENAQPSDLQTLVGPGESFSFI